MEQRGWQGDKQSVGGWEDDKSRTWEGTTRGPSSGNERRLPK